MREDDEIVGNEVLVDGMNISLRYRRDFRVTDAARLLAVARRAYLELNPGSTSEDAEAEVGCAADAIYTILEFDQLLGDQVETRLAARESDGLSLGGWGAQLVLDEPLPLSREPRGNCLRADVFAPPESE
ncbi:hypothetical protein ACFXHA_41235 [Nocardia sp. NPDC059240]|uniref:hypothetical protein n=1 Tax=Nocardia sp. NPDC059240 TaxID=3346786 RepID=UPI003677F447